MTMIDMASRSIIPAVVRWTGTLAATVRDLESIGVSSAVQRELLEASTLLLEEAGAALKELTRLAQQFDRMTDARERAVFCRRQICPAMEALREPADRLEMIVDKEMWPMPSYGDLLFQM